MDWIQAIEVFAMVTGIAYVGLEILQKNAMWVLGIFTGAACAVSFGVQHVWASMVLNLYYVGVSFYGLRAWKKAGAQAGENVIHLRPLPSRVMLYSALAFVLGWLLLAGFLRATGDASPALDASATVLSVIATWWLAQSYLRQWILWIAADIFLTVLCLRTGQYWMALMYAAYTAGAVYGYFHWKKHGKVIS